MDVAAAAPSLEETVASAEAGLAEAQIALEVARVDLDGDRLVGDVQIGADRLGGRGQRLRVDYRDPGRVRADQRRQLVQQPGADDDVVGGGSAHCDHGGGHATSSPAMASATSSAGRPTVLTVTVATDS